MRVGKAKDYRNANGCPALVDVAGKKDALESKIRDEHKRVQIIYNSIRDKHGEYFDIFSKIYNCKCAYCGISVGIIDMRLFEVDHFVCEASFPNDIHGRAISGKASNLVFSCYSCNRGKGNLLIDEGHRRLLNPDNGSIANVFFRDDDYYIRIKKDFCDDQTIEDFYQSLMFGSEFRRLDYLLLEIKHLIVRQRPQNACLADKLEQCMGLMLLKRNSTLI